MTFDRMALIRMTLAARMILADWYWALGRMISARMIHVEWYLSK
jgi:hypothetical protein